jgi:hypothetical protein
MKDIIYTNKSFYVTKFLNIASISPASACLGTMHSAKIVNRTLPSARFRFKAHVIVQSPKIFEGGYQC